MKTRIFLFALMVIIGSCSGKNRLKTEEDTIKTIDLLMEAESEITMLSEIAENIEYIPLETTENSLVGSVTKFIKCDKRIYIKNSFDEIICFDSEGKFINKLNKLGRGPEEYLLISDFDVTTDNKLLVILAGDKIITFRNTGSEFQFAKSMDLNDPVPSRISIIPGTTNILMSVDPVTGKETSLNILINLKGDTLNLKPNSYLFGEDLKGIRRMANESLHYVHAENVFFKEEFSDTVFSIDKNSYEFIPCLILDSHGQGLSPKVRYDREYARNHGNKMYWVYSIMESPGYLLYTYEHNMSRNRIIYNKVANTKYKITLNDPFKDDLAGGPPFDPVLSSDGKMYSLLEVLTLKTHVSKTDFKDIPVNNSGAKEELVRLAHSLYENDNPVVVVVTPNK